MADQKKEIKFNRSMIGDKRNEDFAYLRKQIFNSQTPGLYPAQDLVRQYPQSVLASNDQLVDIAGDVNTFLKVIVAGPSNVYRFYPLGSDVICNNSFTGSIRAVAAGFNQTMNQDGLFFVDETTDKVYSVNYQNANCSEVGTFPSSPSVNIGGYDGLNFWWAGSKIWKQLPEQTPVLAFSNTGFSDLRFMAFYEDEIIFFTQKDNDIYIYFWDKSDTTVFSKRIRIKNSILVGGGVVDDTLMLIRSKYDYSNPKERRGKMIISAWSGISFKELNSIPTGRGNVTIPATTDVHGVSCRCNNEYMLLAVDNNDNETKNADLYVNYVYKIYKDGGIEALSDVVANGNNNFASIVNFGLGFHVIGVFESGGVIPKIYADNDNQNTANNNYIDFTNSVYITNFYCDPFNYHRLDSINISFEKLYRNNGMVTPVDEELDLYYRTSDRLGWTLLGTVTAQKVIDNVNKRLDQTNINTTYPVNEQRYQITKMPDGKALPEFNEIQFKFLSKNGFSVIGAWFEYSYITRNMIK